MWRIIAGENMRWSGSGEEGRMKFGDEYLSRLRALKTPERQTKEQK